MRHFSKILMSLILIYSIQGHSAEIRGKVKFTKDNKTTNLAKTPVRMHIYKDDYEFAGSEVRTNASGEYRFKDLDAGEQYAYILYPIVDGINYPYVELVFDGKNVLEQDFAISESTGSVQNLSVSEMVFFEFGKKNIWKITHDIEVENKGDLLYHSDRPDAEPLLFSLFEGGFNLAYIDGITRQTSKIDDEKDTIQLFATISPHQRQKIRFSYFYVPTKRTFEFKRESFVQRSNITLFFPKSVRVKSELFKKDSNLAGNQKKFPYVYTSGPIARDQIIDYSIRGYLLQYDLIHGLLFLGLALLLASAAWIWIRTKKSKKTSDKELTERLQDYLMEIKKENITDTHQEARIRNFLFELYKKNL